MPSRQTLLAEDAEDLEVVSARLQDALTTVGELKFLPSSRRFVATLSRFMWEREGGRGARGGAAFRVRCGLTFNTVMSVQALNIEMGAPDAYLSLLTIDHRAGAGGLDEIRLVFSGGGIVKLAVEALDAELSDLGKPWKTGSRPAHDPNWVPADKGGAGET